jgi:hypothetical protein
MEWIVEAGAARVEEALEHPQAIAEELVAGIDRIKRRQRQELMRSLQEPHPDSLITAELGLETWSQGLPAGDQNLLDPSAGVPLHWEREKGWQELDA